MHTTTDYKSIIHADWGHNLGGIRSCLNAAYNASIAKCDPKLDPDFDSPNQPSIAGVIRWGLVNRFLHRGCNQGLIKDVDPVWMKASDRGGAHVLELRAKNSAVTAQHLQYPSETPRDSMIREDMRVLNFQNPYLPNFELDPRPLTEPEESEGSLFDWQKERNKDLINLTLVHGSKNAEFAFLRVYYRNGDEISFMSISDNIMNEPFVVDRPEAEEIDGPTVVLRNKEDEKEKRGENNS